MEDGEFQANAGKHSCPGGIPFGEGQAKQFAAICGGRSDEDDDTAGPRGVYLLFDFYLTFQVKCTRGRSDETVGEFEDDFSTRAFRT